MEINEYVRHNGQFAKIIKVLGNNGNTTIYNWQFWIEVDKPIFDGECFFEIEDGGYFKKPSKDIIDLIEVGDYVNGYKVFQIINDIKGFGVIVFEDNTSIHEWQINTVLTHEQFEANAYVLEKER